LSESYEIGELARAFGITPRAIRFYEDKGLVAPRRDGAARIYSEADRRRLALIVRGRRVGLSLADIKETLDLCSSGTNPAGARNAALHLRTRIDALEEQRREIGLVIEELASAADEIEQRLAGAQPRAWGAVQEGIVSRSRAR
jgi:DNA-binding transcriptional MerR regulator